jgi:hypothetical protein
LEQKSKEGDSKQPVASEEKKESAPKETEEEENYDDDFEVRFWLVCLLAILFTGQKKKKPNHQDYGDDFEEEAEEEAPKDQAPEAQKPQTESEQQTPKNNLDPTLRAALDAENAAALKKMQEKAPVKASNASYSGVQLPKRKFIDPKEAQVRVSYFLFFCFIPCSSLSFLFLICNLVPTALFLSLPLFF